MNHNSFPAQNDPKPDSDDNFGPNEDGFDQGDPEPVAPDETVPDAFDPDALEPDEFEPDEFEPDEFEPGGLPVEPDEGPAPDHIPGDPEHDRVIDPGESWAPQASGSGPFPQSCEVATWR